MPPSADGVSVKRPEPVTRPWWRTPISRPGIHDVISMWSASRTGPTLVSQMKRVPVPRVRSPWKRMAVASAIHST